MVCFFDVGHRDVSTVPDGAFLLRSFSAIIGNIRLTSTIVAMLTESSDMGVEYLNVL